MDIRSKFENLINDIHGKGYEIVADFDKEETRIVMFAKYTINITIFLESRIRFDVYCELNNGIYEIGDIHVLLRKMMEIKKICLAYEGEEINTTERLYPEDRRGKNTQTSGL